MNVFTIYVVKGENNLVVTFRFEVALPTKREAENTTTRVWKLGGTNTQTSSMYILHIAESAYRYGMFLEIYWANIVVCSFAFNSELCKAINTKLNCCLFAVDTFLAKPLHSPYPPITNMVCILYAWTVRRFIFGETSEPDREWNGLVCCRDNYLLLTANLVHAYIN